MDRDLDETEMTVAVLDHWWLTGTALGMLIGDAAGFRLVGTFRDPDEVRRASAARPPDVVVANLDGVSGPFAGGVARLRASWSVAVAVVVPVLDAPAIRFALDAHVEALLPRDERPSRVFAALRQVGTGHVVLPRGWQDALAAHQSSRARLEALSRRQREILALLADGRSNDKIARELSISVNTVKFHVRCVYEQLGIRSRLEAARIVAAL